MSAAFLHPFLDAAKEHGCLEGDIAERLGMPLSAFADPAMMISANTVYAFLAWTAGRVGRADFCARIGQRMARGEWKPILSLLSNSPTVDAFLLKFAAIVEDSGGAVAYRLEVEGKIAIWRLTRPRKAIADARFADAVAAGFFVEILRQAAGADWNPRSVVAVTSDGTLIPNDILPATSVIPGSIGFCIRFSSAYLLCEMPKVERRTDISSAHVPTAGPTDLRDRVRQVIELNISRSGFGIDEIASALSISRWKLQSLLRKSGITIAELRAEVRRELAIERVATGNQTISTIAADLGYSSSANFARAFRAWTGKSPKELRRNG